MKVGQDWSAMSDPLLNRQFRRVGRSACAAAAGPETKATGASLTGCQPLTNSPSPEKHSAPFATGLSRPRSRAPSPEALFRIARRLAERGAPPCPR